MRRLLLLISGFAVSVAVRQRSCSTVAPRYFQSDRHIYTETAPYRQGITPIYHSQATAGRQIATFGTCLSLQPIEYGRTQLLQAVSHRYLLASSLRFAYREDDRPMIGNKLLVEDKNGVGAAGLWLVMNDHVCSCLSQQGHKSVVLLLGYRQIWLVSIVPGQRVAHDEGLVRALHQHRA